MIATPSATKEYLQLYTVCIARGGINKKHK
jgi:hypothetical protein